MQRSEWLKRIAGIGALFALIGCVPVTGYGSRPLSQTAPDSTLPTVPQADCSRHIASAHAALVQMSDSAASSAAHAHAAAMHDYLLCLAGTPPTEL
jgi:hypothetical protein